MLSKESKRSYGIKIEHWSMIDIAKSAGGQYIIVDDTVWPENLTGIKFDKIASKLQNKNMTDFNLTK